MTGIKRTFMQITLILLVTGCASSGSYFHDSALNDQNRAPASVALPKLFDPEIPVLDSMRNQAQADFLFLKSELQSGMGQSEAAIETLKNALVYDPEAATFMQKIAIEYYRSGKIKESVVWAERAYHQAPQRRDLGLLVAGLYTTTKNYSAAEAAYKKMLKADPSDTEALFYLGAVYTELKKYQAALKVFADLAKSGSNSTPHLAHYYQARIYTEMGRTKLGAAKAELKKAVAAKPDFFEAAIMLGHLIMQTESEKKAYAFYTEHQKQHGPNAKLAEILSQYYITQNDYDRAYEQLEIIDEAAEDQVQVKLKMALILIDKKMYDEAIPKLNAILKLAPESDKVRFYLSAVYEEKKEFAKAFTEYMKIEETSGFYEESRLHAAQVAKLSGQPEKGIAVLKAAIESKPESPQIYFLLTQLFEESKDLSNALQTIQKAQLQFPENAQVYYFMGALQDQMNLKEDMLKNMQRVIALEPGHAQALNYLAYTWAERGENLERAEEYARLAVKKSQQDVFIMDTLGWVLFKKGQYARAAEILEKAHQMQPQVSIISEHLGDVYTKLNLNSKARMQFLRALEHEADAARKEEIRDKVTQLEDQLKSARTPSSVAADSNTSVSP